MRSMMTGAQGGLAISVSTSCGTIVLLSCLLERLIDM